MLHARRGQRESTPASRLTRTGKQQQEEEEPGAKLSARRSGAHVGPGVTTAGRAVGNCWGRAFRADGGLAELDSARTARGSFASREPVSPVSP